MGRVRSPKVIKHIDVKPEKRPDAAGIDVGCDEVYVAVPSDRDEKPVRKFETFTEDLHRMADWLKACRITTVAMESTGVYWIPLFQVLETRGFEVVLVNARHVKNVPGRKTDVSDAQWLQYLHSVGLLSASFQPPEQVKGVRALMRHRDALVRMGATHIQHVQKALTQMNLQIHRVLSDISGATGLRILDAILAGEHDPRKLAELRNYRVKADAKTIIKSLTGEYRPEHLFTMRLALEAYRYCQRQIEECDNEIEHMLTAFDSLVDPVEEPLPPTARSTRRPRNNEPHFDMRTHLYRIWGTDLTVVPGLEANGLMKIFSEIGPDVSRFPTVEHFTSWLNLCPKNKITGGKVLSSRTGPGVSRSATALRLSAQALHGSRSFLGDNYRRVRSRLGPGGAIAVSAHKLARIIYHLIKTRTAYDESVFVHEAERNRRHIEKRLKRQANALGFNLVQVVP